MSRDELQATIDAIRPPEQPKPTVGRIVHYYRQGGGLLPLGKPLAATITEVHGDGDGRFVALAVFLPGDSDHPVVPYRTVPFAPIPTPGCWSWPPR